MSNKRKPKPLSKPAYVPGPASTSKPASSSEAGLSSLEQRSISSIENALAAVRDLSAARLAAKLSVSRLTGVARELRELLKVMSVYGS